MGYEIVLADPPWAYRAWSRKGHGRSAEHHYPTMGVEDIAALPVAAIAAPDCALFLWATFPNLPAALRVLSAWGFRYATVAFVWVKLNRNSPGLFWGLGYWSRSNAEVCLLGTRGRPRRISARVHQVILAPIGRHSEKPSVTRDRIVELMGDRLRIELFAREKAEGWDALGLEIDGRRLEESLPLLASSTGIHAGHVASREGA